MSNDMKFTDQIVMVSGAASGIGKAAASAIQAARMVICRPEQRDQHKQEWLSRLRAADEETERMCQLVEQFCPMLRTR